MKYESKLFETLLMVDMLTNSHSARERPKQKVCKRAKGNKRTYGPKCKHGGSCDGTKRCKFAIYEK
jgi:hypothetical protein